MRLDASDNSIVGTLGSLASGLAVLGFLVLAFTLMIGGTEGVKRLLGAGTRLLSTGLVAALRFTVGGALLVVVTLVDALITIALTLYQTATGRPYLAGDSWAAFALRLNDRFVKVLL